MGMLQDVKSLRDKALSMYETKRMSEYKLTRDEANNLHIRWPDGYEARIPTIDFRPYQREIREQLINKWSLRVLTQLPRRSGKEVISWNIILDFAVSEPGMYLMVYPTN